MAIEAVNMLRTKPDSADTVAETYREGFHAFLASVRPAWGRERRASGDYLNPFADDWWHVWVAAKRDQS